MQEKSRLEAPVSRYESIAGRLSYVEESLGILDEEGGDVFLKELLAEAASLKQDI